MAQKKTYRLLSLAVMAVVLTALLALSAVAADLSTGFGKILGDVSGYEAASVVLNSTGDDIAELDYFDLDKDSNSGLAGLYYVRPEGSTEKGELIYVYGSYADRKVPFVFDESTNVAYTTGSELEEGKWTIPSSDRSVAYTDATKTTVKSFRFNTDNFSGLTTYTPEYWTLVNNRDTLITKMGTNANAATLLATADKYYDAYYGYTEDEGGNKVYNTELNADGEARKTELFNTIIGIIEKYKFTYAFDNTDVIPVNEFSGFSFSTPNNHRGLQSTTISNRSVTFYIVRADGTFDTSTWSEGKDVTFYDSSSIVTTANLPEDGWIVGMVVEPFKGVSAINDTWNSLASAASFNAAFNPCNMGVVISAYSISLPQGPKPYGLTFDDMTVSGLDKNVTYNARPYTINGVDTESDPVVISGVEEYTFDEAGLWAISCATCDDYTESDYVLVYANGLASDRQKIGTFEDGATLPAKSAGDISAPKYVVGKFVVQGADSGIGEENGYYWFRATGHSLDKDNSYYKAIYDAKAAFDEGTGTEQDLIDAKSNLSEHLKQIYTTYAYASDEIIPSNELKSIAFAFKKHQGLIYQTKPTVVFKVLNINTKVVTDYTWAATSVVANGGKVIVDASSVLPQEENNFVVGFEIHHWGAMTGSELTVESYDPTNYNNCNFQSITCFYYGLEDYVIKTPKAATPEGLETVDSVLSGLDDELTYIARPYAINGVIEDAEPVTITKVPEFDFATVDGAGLYAVSVAANGLEWSESDAVLVYIRGDYEDRANILDVNANGANVWESSSKFVVGSLSTSYTINGTSGSSNDYAQNDLVQAIYGSKYLATAPDSSDPTAVENMKTKFEKSAETISATFFKYAFDSDEIVPISEVVSYKWGLGVHYTQFRYTANISSKFVAYVMDDDGNIESYEYIHAAAPFTSDIELSDSYDNTNLMTSSKYVKTVDFTNKSSDFGEWQQVLPTTGYFVGFEVLPLADMNNYSYVTHGGNVNSVDYFTIVVHNSKDNYVIAKPKYDAPEGLVVKGATVSNLDADITYVAYQVNVNGYDLENYVTIKNTTEYTFADDEVGLWAITIPGDANYDASDAGAYVFNRALTSDLTKLGTFETETSTVPQGATGSYPNVFVPGKFVTSSKFNGAVRDYMPSAGLASNSVSTTNSYQFHQVESWLDTNDADVVALVEAKAAQNATAILQAQQNILVKLKKFSMTYAFMPDEVVPVRDMVSFKYGTRSVQGNFGYFQPSVIFYTIDSDGEKHDYTWNASSKKNAHYYQLVCNWTVDAVTALAEAGDDEVVVALEFMPYAALPVDQVSNWSGLSTSYNANQQVAHYFWFDSYDIKKPQAAAPTELELVGKKVTGFLEGVDYKYAPVTVNGVDYDAAADLTEETTLTVGLWAAYYPENDDFTASAPAIFFVRGSASARQEIGTMMETAPTGYTKYPQYATKNEDGTWTIGKFVSNGGRAIETPSGTVNSSRYAFRVTSFHGASALANALNADNATNIATARTGIKTAYEAMTLKYAYNQDEVIPVDELLNFKVETYIDQGPFKYLYAEPKVVFTVVKEDGSVCYPSWTGARFTVTGGAQTINTVTLTEDILTEVFAGVDGYVVAFEYSPWSNIDSSAVIPLTNSNTGAYVVYATNFWFRFYHGTSDYAVAEDPAEINASLLLDGKIGLKIEADFKDATITEATYEGFTPDSFTVKDGIATAIVYVAPKDASTVALTGSITAGGETLEFADVTVATCISAYTESSNELLKALATALDVYCDYAENYFADAPTVPALDDIELEPTDVEANCAKGKTGDLTAAGIEFKSTSLILEGATTIRHYFKIVDADAFALYTTNLNKVNYADDIYYFEIENIAAHALNAENSVATITATPAEGEALTMTLNFSAVNYVESAFNSNNGRLVNLVKALYKYSVAADAYWAVYGNN